MKKIIAVIIACAALLTVGFAVGKNYGGQVEKYVAESYEEESADEKVTVRYEDESVSEQEDRGTETLFENSSEEDEKIKKLAENRPVYNCIEPDGKGAALYKDPESGGMNRTWYYLYFTEDGGKTWELNEHLYLLSGYYDFVFINGKFIIFGFDSFNRFMSSVSISDPETGEGTGYYGEELINRTGFSEYGVTELRLCADVLYQNDAAGTFTVGWAYPGFCVDGSGEKSDYLFIAEYSSELELVNTVFLDEELISAYKIIQESEPDLIELMLVPDRKLTEDDVNDIMKLDCLGINIASVVLDAKKEYEEKKDKTETDLYNYKFLSGWKTDGRSLYFSAPE